MAKKKTFLEKLFADGETDTVSSKRLIAIFSFITLVSLSFLSAFGYSANINFIYIFGALSGGQSILTTIEKVRRN